MKRGQLPIFIGLLSTGVVVGVVVGLVWWGSPVPTAAAAPPGCTPSAPRLTVQGTGMATGTPNLLTLTASVDTTGSSAQSALSTNNTEATQVIAVLTGGGVAQHDIQTTGFSIQPSYSLQNGSMVLTGYSVDNSVVAKLRNFLTAGQLIDSVTGAAGNDVRVTSLAFSIEDSRRLEDRARNDAVSQAVSHATAMAASADERLAGVCSISDQSSVIPELLPSRAAALPASPGTNAVPLQAGSQEASAQVSVTYALAPARDGR